MRINQYRIEFRVSPCTHPHTPDIDSGYVLNTFDGKWKCQALDILAYLLKATVQLLADSSETSVSRQWPQNWQQNDICR
jgi:hypothetical protein